METVNPFPTNGVQCAQKGKGIPLVPRCFFHPLIQQDSNNSLSNNTGSWAIYHPAIQAFKLVGFSLALTNPVPAEWLNFFPLPTWSFVPEVIPHTRGWGRAENTSEWGWPSLGCVPSPNSGRIRKNPQFNQPDQIQRWGGKERRGDELFAPNWGFEEVGNGNSTLPAEAAPQFLLYPGDGTQRETLSQGWQELHKNKFFGEKNCTNPNQT